MIEIWLLQFYPTYFVGQDKRQQAILPKFRIFCGKLHFWLLQLLKRKLSDCNSNIQNRSGEKTDGCFFLIDLVMQFTQHTIVCHFTLTPVADCPRCLRSMTSVRTGRIQNNGSIRYTFRCPTHTNHKQSYLSGTIFFTGRLTMTRMIAIITGFAHEGGESAVWVYCMSLATHTRVIEPGGIDILTLVWDRDQGLVKTLGLVWDFRTVI
jgi:hypothetical protein